MLLKELVAVRNYVDYWEENPNEYSAIACKEIFDEVFSTKDAQKVKIVVCDAPIEGAVEIEVTFDKNEVAKLFINWEGGIKADVFDWVSKKLYSALDGFNSTIWVKVEILS